MYTAFPESRVIYKISNCNIVQYTKNRPKFKEYIFKPKNKILALYLWKVLTRAQ